MITPRHVQPGTWPNHGLPYENQHGPCNTSSHLLCPSPELSAHTLASYCDTVYRTQDIGFCGVLTALSPPLSIGKHRQTARPMPRTVTHPNTQHQSTCVSREYDIKTSLYHETLLFSTTYSKGVVISTLLTSAHLLTPPLIYYSLYTHSLYFPVNVATLRLLFLCVFSFTKSSSNYDALNHLMQSL